MQGTAKIQQQNTSLPPETLMAIQQPPLPSSQSYYLQYMRQLLSMMEAANQLSSELMRNNELINQYLSIKPPQAQTLQKSLNKSQQNSNKSTKNEPQSPSSSPHLDNEQPISLSHQHDRMMPSDEQSYKPEVQDYDGTYYPPVDSKNITKNYGNAIFCFIDNHPHYVRSLLQKLRISHQQFAQSCEELKGTIGSIAQLRGLWTGSQRNKYGKVYRILSMQYLRKYSLEYIYNSKISKHLKHIKYRHVIMRNLRQPEMFTLIKEF